jgi:hypothetical protein
MLAKALAPDDVRELEATKIMTNGKDSADVVKFLTLLAKLKDCCDDDPQYLSDLAKEDEGVKDLCCRLAFTSSSLRMNERRHRQLFAAPVDPKFLNAFRDFEERYAKPVAGIWLADILPELDAPERGHGTEADLHWDNADYDGDEQAGAIENAIDFAHEQATDSWRDFSDEFRESIEDATAAWERLKQDAGFDLRGVFRRRELVPFVLVPRHVAAKHGSAETLSMLRNLQQAHDAFVFGAPFAALALMRSIMEGLLRDHYHAEGKDLADRIGQAAKRLPNGASAAALHRLRKIANAILHLDPEKHEGLPMLDPSQLEKEIVSLLFVLRALIEAAPTRRAR